MEYISGKGNKFIQYWFSFLKSEFSELVLTIKWPKMSEKEAVEIEESVENVPLKAYFVQFAMVLIGMCNLLILKYT